MRKDKILKSGFITALIVLFCNDLFLKQLYPGIITGKISDFAGLFVFPILFTDLFPKYKKSIYALTFTLFIFWKSELVTPIITFWNNYIPYKIGRVVDYSDYIALLVLPISYNYKQNGTFYNLRLKQLVVIFSFIVFCSSVGTEKYITHFNIEYSKKEIYSAYNIMLRKYPEYEVPSNLKVYTTLHYGNDEFVMKNGMGSDSVNLRFYLKEKDMILRFKFSGSNANWYGGVSDIALTCPYSKQYGYKDEITMKGKKVAKKALREEILPKLKTILKEEREKKGK